ncbi:MAG: sigma-54 dependent transcriptional regulator [Nitrospirota bacterium]
MKLNILLVDDDPATIFGFSKYLSQKGYDVKGVSRLSEARQAITSQQFDAVILDLILPDGNGIDLITELRETSPGMAIIVVTGKGDIPVAVEAMRRGAANFLEKPVNMEYLEVFLQKSLEMGALRRRDLTNQRLHKQVQPSFGKGPSMGKVKELASMAAKTDVPVLLQGETGTGKSILARWIHEQSDHISSAFVEVSCSSLRGELLASELFGHVKGAFTSAVQDRQGFIEAANKGTLFLDEIGDMDIGVQAQFLKVIEEKTYRRLGEVKVRKSDFRPICATNKNLQEEVKEGRFRQDLYFRVNSFPILIPPLRERLEDLPELIQHIVNELGAPNAKISGETLKLLKEYSWPGNIRELKNVVERSLILSRSGLLNPEHFPGLEACSAPVFSLQEEGGDLKHQEKEHIMAVLERSGGNKIKAAKALGISKATLYRKLKTFGIS